MEEENVTPKKKMSTTAKSIIIIAVIVVLIAAAWLVYTVTVAVDYAKEATIFQEQMQKTAQALENMQEPDMTIYSKGKIGELEKYLKDGSKEVVVTSKKVIEVTEEFELFSAQSLSQDSSLTKHKEVIANLKSASTDMTNAALDLLDPDKLTQKIKSLSFGKELEEELINGIIPTYQTLYSEIETEGEDMERMIKVFEQLADFLVENSDAWSIENNTLMFTNSTILKQYNDLVGKL